ncbi:uncharacterized protein BP5553_08320 [Venustampulla echinocandica]|uniref:MINDY deubiquitinase domain-containing protein n=1 Tax=Venustampulla echinocandica TaxID=2656787 RepID=A0A370TGC8_9HELO|nr:uncharacterized protein BP5553_08320 [Venustampulla echinocandica]RDL33952.1 hypothetical protein BP5553_08320 [Venustampulla echinocandica]
MVTRKPVPQGEGAGPSLARNSPPAASSPPPYPLTPISTDVPPTLRIQDMRSDLLPSADSEYEGENVWSREGAGAGTELSGEKVYELRPPYELPGSLQIGTPGLSNSASKEMLRPSPTSTNPFLQRQAQQHGAEKQNSAPAWGGFSERPPQPLEAPPRPLITQGGGHGQAEPPSYQFSSLSVSEPSTNPWQPALDEKPRVQPPPLPTVQREDSGNEAWSSTVPARQAPSPPSETSQQPVLVDIDDPESPAWDEDGDDDDDESSPPAAQAAPASNPQEAQQIDEDRHIWEENQGPELKQDATVASQFLAQEDPAQPSEGWNLIDHEPVGSGTQQNGVVLIDPATQSQPKAESDPGLLHRPQDLPPQSDRSNITSSNRSASPARIRQIPESVIRAQKQETYEIKKISWHDVTAAKNPRVSPILVQNANGPCPLLALVNALTLSTPADVETALVETLRSREQVSLGLLLDAVFDELMSGRRGDAAQELPDVSDLYSFLITLHTGMNVNPLFFAPAPAKTRHDPRSSMSHVHPSEREDAIPGTFEDTREMNLYSTFSVPLIHGWLPEPGSAEYTALARSAKSYEDAQNLMFHEEELEDKLRNEGLSFEEQATLEDIATIKAFFSSNATQLTRFGLQTITSSSAPGATAILFRNDHFSTLYRHPDTLQLLQLVTDMGYAGHEEVVWESLIDVNGENAEFFSGDFRLVGGAPATPSHSNTRESGSGWPAATERRQSQNQNPPNLSLSPPDTQPVSPRSPNIEQEDHDLALALQLQEEEEERHRNEVARQRHERESQLSQQYIDQQGSENSNVPVNMRGGRGGRGSQNRGRGVRVVRPTVARPEPIPRRNNQPSATPARAADPEAGIDAPPPSYEQAATQAAYIPPADHPSHPTANPISPTTTGRRTSAYSSTSSGIQAQTSPAVGRDRRQTTALVDQISPSRRNMGPGVAQLHVKERDCIVM